MRILLDTHTAIWAVTASNRLPDRILGFISTADQCYVSLCSIWEIAIKSAPGRKSTAPISATNALSEFQRADFQLLDIRVAHILVLADLSLDHGDPFDRLILAQALAEPLHLVTKDRRLAAYGEPVISW